MTCEVSEMTITHSYAYTSRSRAPSVNHALRSHSQHYPDHEVLRAQYNFSLKPKATQQILSAA